jgi:hypothetical protein
LLQLEEQYLQSEQATRDKYEYHELEVGLDDNTNSQNSLDLNLNEILGVRTFDEYIAVIHAIIQGRKRILKCQICSRPIVKDITSTADERQICEAQKRNSLLCKNCLRGCNYKII